MADEEHGSRGRPDEQGRRANRRAARVQALILRRRSRLIATGVVGLLVVVVAVAELGLDRFAQSGQAGPTPLPTPPPPALNPGARPSATIVSSPSPTQAPIAVSITFDMIPVGPLAVETPVAGVVGAPEVTPFPSPFDRSLHLTGAGDQGLCLAIEGLDSGALSVSFDAYLDAPPAGSLAIILDPSAATAVTHELAPEVLVGLAPQQWYSFELHRTEGGEATLGARPRDEGTGASQLPVELAPPHPASIDQAACLLLSGATAETSLSIDNLRVEQ